MHPIAYVFMAFGAILAVAGILLFARMGTQGSSSIKMFGFEFQLGGSALVVFVVGALLFLVLVIYSDTLLQNDQPSVPQRAPGIVAAPGLLTQAPVVDLSKTQQESGRFVIVDSSGELELGEGLFSSVDSCRARGKQLADSWRYERCLAAPSSAFCLSYSDPEDQHWWECYETSEACMETLVLHDLEAEMSDKRILTRCEPMSLDEASRRAS